jgi:flagellar motor protein MotB
MGIAAAVLALGAMGCQNKVHDENVALHRQNRELQAQLTDSQNKLRTAPDPAQLQAMQQEIQARDAKIAELQTQLQQPAPGQVSDMGLKGIEVTRDDKAGTVTVNVPGDVLFTSGKAELKDSSKATLNKIVAAIKKEYPGKKVYIDGYTDSDPISKTKDKWEDNLDLSAARARSVYAYLVSQGLETKNVAPRAMGATNPKQSKDRSRRVEIVVATVN